MNINYQYLDPLLAKITYMSDADIQRVKDAYAIAYEGHDGQTRSSGQPYITHPVAVAGILADMKLDLESVQAALLHDTIEDTKYTRDDLVQLFGEGVARIVDGVSKLDKLKFRTRQEAEVANFRKMILAMTKDIRVVLIKLADRTHNMRTISALRPDKQRRIAQETVDIYCALAYRLGIMHIKRELDSLSFQAIFPLRYRLLEKSFNKIKVKHFDDIIATQQLINNQLQQQGIKATVELEALPLLYIYRRMAHKRQKFSKIFDLYRFIIKTDTVDACYRTLGVVHNLFKPVPNSFKDFIALPKINGYQSLATDLVNNSGDPIEVFIRTQHMDDIAEIGIASTLTYAQSSLDNSIGKERIDRWLNSLAELQNISVNSIEFNNSIKEEIFPEDIFVFTPRGKIIELPLHSTVLDFAFYIHTNIGVHAVKGLVDGQEASLDTPLKSGQTVEIITDANNYSTEESLSAVRSSRAKARIREALKEREMDKYIAFGRDIMERVFQIKMEQLDTHALHKALEFFNLKSLNDLFAEISFGNIISPVVKAVYDSYTNHGGTSNILQELQTGVLVSDLTYQDLVTRGARVTIDPKSFVTPNDQIMITSNHGKGLVVHHVSSNVIAQKNLTPYQHILLTWGTDTIKRSFVKVKFIIGHDRKFEDIVDTLVTYVNKHNIHMLRAVSDTNPYGNPCSVTLDLLVHSSAESQELLRYINQETDLDIVAAERVYVETHK